MENFFCKQNLYRYLNKIFEIPSGKKCELVKIPSIIKNSNLKYQIAFSVRVLMFDGGIGLRRVYFNLSTKSQFLIKDIENIMRKAQIKPDYVSDSIISSTGVFELRIWKKEKLRKILNTFIEPNTIKWSQLNSSINAFKVQSTNG